MISFVILTWNSEKFIEECLVSILAQTYKDFEIIIVDNGSTDTTLTLLEKYWNKIRLIKNSTNRGFAISQNQGLNAVSPRARYVMPLNNDVIMAPEYVQKIINKIEVRDDIGYASGKIYKVQSLDPNYKTIDTVQLSTTRHRWFFDEGECVVETPWEKRFLEDKIITGVCACSPVYKTACLDDIRYGHEYFDESYFMYFEDIDLCWRAYIAGWKGLFVHDAIAKHYREGTKLSLEKKTLRKYIKRNRYLSFRNRYYTIIKNDNGLLMLLHSPYLFFFEIINLIKVIRFPYLLKAYWEIFVNLRDLLKKRRFIQGKSRITFHDRRRFYIHDNKDLYTTLLSSDGLKSTIGFARNNARD